LGGRREQGGVSGGKDKEEGPCERKPNLPFFLREEREPGGANEGGRLCLQRRSKGGSSWERRRGGLLFYLFCCLRPCHRPEMEGVYLAVGKERGEGKGFSIATSGGGKNDLLGKREVRTKRGNII